MAFPHLYSIKLAGQDGPDAVVEAPPRPALEGSAPPEFGGEGLRWDPERLLLASMALCHRTTFEALAKRAGLAYEGYEAEAEADLDKTREGLHFTAFRLRVRVRSSDPEKAEKLLQSAERYCVVSNALKLPVGFEGSATPSA